MKNIKNEGVRRLATHRASSRSVDGTTTKDQGFGTMDVLIAVLILGIMSAISVTALGTMLTTAHKGSCESDGATLATAISEWNAQTNNQPLSLLVQLTTQVTATNGAIVGPLLQNLPGTGNGYQFGLVQSPNPNTLLIEAPVTAAWTTTPVNNGTLATGEPWTGPSLCAGVA